MMYMVPCIKCPAGNSYPFPCLVVDWALHACDINANERMYSLQTLMMCGVGDGCCGAYLLALPHESVLPLFCQAAVRQSTMNKKCLDQSSRAIMLEKCYTSCTKDCSVAFSVHDVTLPRHFAWYLEGVLISSLACSGLHESSVCSMLL